jgi:hypothetical protein
VEARLYHLSPPLARISVISYLNYSRIVAQAKTRAEKVIGDQILDTFWRETVRRERANAQILALTNWADI